MLNKQTKIGIFYMIKLDGDSFIIKCCDGWRYLLNKLDLNHFRPHTLLTGF